MSKITDRDKHRAKDIYRVLFGYPKTHQAWAERFNKVQLIDDIIHQRPSARHHQTARMDMYLGMDPGEYFEQLDKLKIPYIPNLDELDEILKNL